MPVLTVKQNIKMGANLAGNKDYEEIIAHVGLKGKENRLPAELSGGERQRVSLARALAKRPKILFCDEPTGALDEATGRKILKYLIDNQKREGYTMIMVTHNENIALLADKIIRMNSGKIVGVFPNRPQTVEEIGW
jgi:putative ABC transport system ATP-binding protein